MGYTDLGSDIATISLGLQHLHMIGMKNDEIKGFFVDIKILGTRGEIEPSAPYHAKKSGVLIDGKILLDCGDQRFLAYHPHYVLMTHLHPDHAFFTRGDKRYYIPDVPLFHQNISIRCRSLSPKNHSRLMAIELHRYRQFTVLK